MSLSEPDELNLIPWTLGSYAGIQSYRANNYKIPDLSYYLGKKGNAFVQDPHSERCTSFPPRLQHCYGTG